MKKILSIILAILMIVTTIPIAFAAEGETRTIYVKEEITGFVFGNGYEYWFADEDGNELECTNEYLGDDLYKYTVPVSAAKYYMWEGIGGGGGDWFTYEPIPEKVDTLINRDGAGEWYCSHQMNTSGELTDEGYLCDICGEFYHVCEFIGEWEYDSFKHWNECECGEIYEESHTFADGKCVICGKEGAVLTIKMIDSYGDGWNGNTIAIEKLIDGEYSEISRATVDEGSEATYTVVLDACESYILKWIKYSYPSECSFVISVDDKDVCNIDDASVLTNGQILYSIALHNWGEGVLTRPTKTEEGYYTYICSACGDTKTEAAQRAANYAEYTKALNDLRAYLDSDKLTDDVKASVAEWLEIYDSDEAYKFIAGEEETVNLYIEAALQYAAEIEAAIQDCLAGDHSGNGEYCDICGAALHTCDFTGEWKYDSEKHWKECTEDGCDKTSEEAEHTLTDGKCDVCEYLFYKIMHQPTAEQPYVELNDDTDASYQWYTVDLNKNEVVDDGVIGKTNGSVYKGEIGWRPTLSLDGSADFLVVKLKKGQMLTLVPSAYCGKLSIIKNGTYLTKADCQAGEELTYIAEADGLYNVFSENYTSGTSLRAYITDITYTLVDGETSARLQHHVLGEVYACEVTFRDGTKEMSDSFVSNHTCDFTGEWKYGSETHWKECTCGEIDEEAVHTLTEGKCDCGYECPHEETYETVTRLEHFSVQNPDGTWTKATISVVCRECESVIEYKEADRADYTEFDKYMARACELLDTGNLTENAYIQYSKPVNNIKNSVPIMGSPFQSTPDTYVESLEYIITEIEAGIANGTMKKADWTFMTAILDEIKALIDNDPNKIIPSMVGYYYGPNGFYSGSFGNPNYSQADYDRVMTEYGFKNQLETLLAGLKDGTMLKADYTAIDEAIAALDEKLADVNLTDEAKTEIEDIRAQLEEMKKNPLTSKVDVEELMDAVEELDEAIEDGTVVIAEGSVILEAYDEECGRIMSEKYGEEAVNRIVSIMMQNKNEELVELYAYADTITGTIAENADKIEELKRKMDALYAAIERCIIGTHTVEEYAITSSAKCGVNAVETGICYYCVETVTREVENSALTHSFTKYEVTEEAKCGIEGKEVAVCDHGCGETDEKAIEALEHLFIDYIYNEDATCTADGTKTAECVYGCGETDTVTAEDTMLDHADEDGDKICDDCETEIADEALINQISTYISLVLDLIKLILSFVEMLGIFA